MNEDQGEDLFHYHQAYEFYNPMQQPANYNYNGPHLVHSFSSYTNFSSDKPYGSFNNNNQNNMKTPNNHSNNNNNIKKKQKFPNYKTWNHQVPNYNSTGLIGKNQQQRDPCLLLI